MAKMYYSEEEAAAKLGISVEELVDYVRDEKLRVFRDGSRNMYKAGEVDELAPPSSGDEEIELAPVEEIPDAAKLTQADEARPAGKEDTVITAEGISIFDDDDLGIEAADPMAKTQINPSIGDQVPIEGVGSGSGLLDLTREGDDTSLGAEVLDHIDIEEPLGEEEAPEGGSGGYGAAGAGETVVIAPEAAVIDAGTGLLSGFIVATTLLVLLAGAVTLAAAHYVVPDYLAFLKKNSIAVVIGAAVIVGVFGVIGMLIGKSIAQRRQVVR